MDIKEVLEALKGFENTEEYNNYVSGLINTDRVSKFLETEDGKKFHQPILDKYHSKGLESWKTSSLPKLLDEEIKKKFPDKDPKDVELADIKTQLNNMKLEAVRKENFIKASKIATEKKIPIEMIDYLVSDTEEATTANLEKFGKIFNDSVLAGVKEKIPTYTPPNGDKGNVDDLCYE